ncbi:hypothetical protein XI09_30155 [Bradyrhizobium sp. CCBAU 11386]|nr:hypothetical protein [Bradyrhizobium sp. CCBAU 11386]
MDVRQRDVIIDPPQMTNRKSRDLHRSVCLITTKSDKGQLKIARCSEPLQRGAKLSITLSRVRRCAKRAERNEMPVCRQIEPSPRGQSVTRIEYVEVHPSRNVLNAQLSEQVRAPRQIGDPAARRNDSQIEIAKSGLTREDSRPGNVIVRFAAKLRARTARPLKSHASTWIMTPAAEWPDVRQPPDHRFLDCLKLTRSQETTGNPVKTHHVGARQQPQIQTTIAESHRRKRRAASILVLPKSARIEIGHDVADEVPNSRQVRRHDGGIVEMLPSAMEDRVHSSTQKIAVKAKRSLVRSAFAVGLGQMHDAESIERHVRRARLR